MILTLAAENVRHGITANAVLRAVAPSWGSRCCCRTCALVRYGKAYLAADDGPGVSKPWATSSDPDWIATQPSWTRRASRVRRQLWRLHDARDRRLPERPRPAAVDVVGISNWSPSWRTRRPTGATCAARSTVTSAIQRPCSAGAHLAAAQRAEDRGGALRPAGLQRPAGPAQRGGADRQGGACPRQGRLVPARDERRHGFAKKETATTLLLRPRSSSSRSCWSR